MEKKVIIKSGEIEGQAVLNDSQTAQRIWDILPVESTVNTWGEEIYFSIPLKDELGENPREVVEIGDLGYWPPGRGFCIFFGPTPISSGNEIRPASPVNLIGKVHGNIKEFKKVKSGEKIIVEKMGEEKV